MDERQYTTRIEYTQRLCTGRIKRWTHETKWFTSAGAIADVLSSTLSAMENGWKISYSIFGLTEFDALSQDHRSMTLDFMPQPEPVKSRTKGQRTPQVTPVSVEYATLELGN